MSYTAPNVSDFKGQFDRDFPLAVPAFGAAGVVRLSAGAVSSVDLAAGGEGYLNAPTVIVVDQGGTAATVTATIQNGSVNGFLVGAGGSGYIAPTLLITGGAGNDNDKAKVRDRDIQRALNQALANMNPALFPNNQAAYTQAYLFLAAHRLVENLRSSGEGVRGMGQWLTESRSVGDVSTTQKIPDKIAQDPLLQSLSTTRYGRSFLEMMLPFLVGNMNTAFRQTLP